MKYCFIDVAFQVLWSIALVFGCIRHLARVLVHVEHNSGLEKLCNTWHNSLAMLSVTEEVKVTVIFCSTVAQFNSSFTKATSCWDPVNLVISISWRWFNKSFSVFQLSCSSQMQPGGQAVCSWNQDHINMVRLTDKELSMKLRLPEYVIKTSSTFAKRIPPRH